MIEVKGIGGKRKLLIENYREFLRVLETEGRNVFSASVETRKDITYFAIVLNK